MKIAIWGMGVSGLSALKAVSSTSHEIYAINSGAPSGWSHLDEIIGFIPISHCLEESQEICNYSFDQIILSPGIDRKSPLVSHFIKKGVEVIGEIEYAARLVSLPIVAITGTNGKTTTTTMISECLKKAGREVFVGGNIGRPFCEILSDDKEYDIAVLELSSFQLESIDRFRADVAIVLNISESHMERYDRVEDYIEAKLNIFKNQKSSDLALAPSIYLPSHGINLQSLDSTILEGTKLKGNHHLENLFCVEKTLEHFGVESPREVVIDFLSNFSGVDYRLQLIGERAGVSFYNDAKSTNPHSTLAACEIFGDKSYLLIMGGKLRDENTDLRSVLGTIKPSKIFAFGESAKLISQQLNNIAEVEVYDSLSDIFKNFEEVIPEVDVLFSPGFPSFDQYRNYTERGIEFNSLFKSLQF